MLTVKQDPNLDVEALPTQNQMFATTTTTLVKKQGSANLHVPFRGGRTATASTVRYNNTHLMHIKDPLTGLRFLIDTGAEVSILPFPCGSKENLSTTSMLLMEASSIPVTDCSPVPYLLDSVAYSVGYLLGHPSCDQS